MPVNEDQSEDVLVFEEVQQGDALFSAGIALPGYEDTSDKKVLGAVRQTFKDFSYDATDDASRQFKDVDAIAQYMQASIEEINAARQMGDRLEVGRNAAITARFWYMAERINSALVSGKYGEGVSKQLSAKIKLAPSMIYSIRAVATKLTPSDCWLLGTRGCKPTHLRKLAAISDDGTRSAVISAFLSEASNTADTEALDKARKKLAAACNMKQGDFGRLATSDPVNGGTEIDVSEEYTQGMKQLHTLEKLLRPLADVEKCIDMREAYGRIYVSDRVPDAEDKVGAVLLEADKILEMYERVVPHLNDLLAEVKSLRAGLTVTDDNGDPVSKQ